MRLEEGAARSVFRSSLNALEFFEEAGEDPAGKRLSGLPGLEGAVLEFELKRCRQTEMDGEQLGKKQAPQMVLAVLVAFEKVVIDEARNLFERAYAWYAGSSELTIHTTRTLASMLSRNIDSEPPSASSRSS